MSHKIAAGDLCIIIRSLAGNEGKAVTVKSFEEYDFTFHPREYAGHVIACVTGDGLMRKFRGAFFAHEIVVPYDPTYMRAPRLPVAWLMKITPPDDMTSDETEAKILEAMQNV